MAHAWEWSIRAIRAIQILAEEWAVSETIQINQQLRTSTLGDGLGETVDETTPANDTSEFFRSGDESDWTTLSEFTNIDWLTQLDSSMMDVDIDEVIFDQHLWPVGFREQPH